VLSEYHYVTPAAYGISKSSFDVLLTVRLSVILVINQLDAQNLVLL